MKNKHTKCKWAISPKSWGKGQCGGSIIGADNKSICAISTSIHRSREESEANAAHIVKCVNLHDELVEELSIIHSDMIPEGPDCEAWHRIKLLLKRAKDS